MRQDEGCLLLLSFQLRDGRPGTFRPAGGRLSLAMAYCRSSSGNSLTEGERSPEIGTPRPWKREDRTPQAAKSTLELS